VRYSKLSNETHRSDAVTAYYERRARLVVVGEPGEEYCYYGSEEVDGNCEELGVSGGVAEAVNHGWDCGCEATSNVSTSWTRSTWIVG
jgi:hypothetical protein